MVLTISASFVACQQILGYNTQIIGGIVLHNTKGKWVLSTGNQLRAARALADLEQSALAEKARVSVNTIRNMEAAKGGLIRGNNQTVVSVQQALESVGIEFLNHGQPGVRLRAPKSE